MVTQTDPLAHDAIAAIDAAFGEHDGRAVHVKGAWARGTFTGTPEGAALCRAPFLSGEPVEALVRFSNGGGDPAAHDGGRDGRGIGVKLFLADGVTDLLGLSVPAFSSRTPEDFVELVQLARTPERMGPFLEAHPETLAAIQARFAIAPPESWTDLPYNGIHAFRWTAPGGAARWVRTRWTPDEPRDGLSDEEAAAREPGYLAAALRERLAGDGTQAFTLLARLAQDGDPLDDLTAAWPEEREAVAVGRLVLEEAIDDPETPEDIHVFDPLRLCDGIEPSDDPILHFRRRAYDVSARRRWAGASGST